MKPSLTFVVTCFIIIGCAMISILAQHFSLKVFLNSNHNQIRLLIDQIEDLKEEFNGNPAEAITKSDLTALTEINRYQSEIVKLRIENKIELSKGYPKIFPDYFLIILIIWLSFQLDNMIKQNRSFRTKIKSEENKSVLNEDKIFALQVESMKKKLEKQSDENKSELK